jgi:uncharacterized membrane protein
MKVVLRICVLYGRGLMLRYSEDIDVPMDKRIINLLKETFKKNKGTLTVKEIVRKLDCPFSTVNKILLKLAESSVIQRFKKGNCFYYLVKL